MMESVLNIKGLTKKHFKQTILEDINLEVGCGKNIGVLGSNASGKTTLLNVIAGITRYNAGEVIVCGKPLSPDTKQSVAYLTDRHIFEKWMSIKDCIKLYASSFHGFDAAKIETNLGTYGMNSKTKLTELSRGKLEILAVLLTLSRKAKLYLFDEPLAAVDVAAREKIMGLLVEHMDENCSMMIATHSLKDIGKVFDEVIMMHEGRILRTVNVEEMKMSEGKSVEEVFKEMFENVYTDAITGF